MSDTGVPDGPSCRCSHLATSHNIGTRKGVDVRTACSHGTAAGPCGCKRYEPSTEDTDAEN